MITTIQEGDIVSVELIHTRDDSDKLIMEALVVRADSIGMVIDVERFGDKDPETNKYTKIHHHIFIPWSNVMAAHVLRDGVESSGNDYAGLKYVLGSVFEDEEGNEISQAEKRHREMLAAQQAVTFFNGDL